MSTGFLSTSNSQNYQMHGNRDNWNYQTSHAYDQANNNKGEDAKANDSNKDPDNNNGKDVKDEDNNCENAHASNNEDETASHDRDNNNIMPSIKQGRGFY